MSSRRLPPLNALRAFEAAARHLSFSAAAAELHVTPAAVSHQIKALEDDLGVKLFRRLNREVRLTDAGQSCLPGLRDGFDRIAEAVGLAQRQDAAGILTVTCSPALAAKFLVPRVEAFRTLHPDIDLRVDASMHLVDFARENVHVALRYGRGHYPGLNAELLLRTEVVPVCAPALLRGAHPIRNPADLRHHTLIHDETLAHDQSCPEWAMWLRAAGVAGIDVGRGLRFNQVALALDAAIAGRGVVLTRNVFAADDLAAGRLVRLFGASTPVEFAVYLVTPPRLAALPKVKAFCEWVTAEAQTLSEAPRPAPVEAKARERAVAARVSAPAGRRKRA
jgi:LysR family transcriptional regulator, glycine cleavage system transcriptional activator